jgi:hypothetical protein
MNSFSVINLFAIIGFLVMLFSIYLSGLNLMNINFAENCKYKSLYLLEALIAEKPNSNNLNSIDMLYKDIKDFLTNNK